MGPCEDGGRARWHFGGSREDLSEVGHLHPSLKKDQPQRCRGRTGGEAVRDLDTQSRSGITWDLLEI